MNHSTNISSTAVLALHYQNDVLHAEGRVRVGFAEHAQTRERVVSAARSLIDGARKLDLPLFHVRIAFRADYADLIQNAWIFRQTAKLGALKDGTWGAEFHSGLEADESHPNEFVIRHQRTSAFIGTPLEQMLTQRGIRHLIVAGVATHSVVEMTVRHAADLGYAVTVAADACAAADPHVHAASLQNMRVIAEIGTVQSALSDLEARCEPR